VCTPACGSLSSICIDARGIAMVTVLRWADAGYLAKTARFLSATRIGAQSASMWFALAHPTLTTLTRTHQ
jgi:hypothetical protein